MCGRYIYAQLYKPTSHLGGPLPLCPTSGLPVGGSHFRRETNGFKASQKLRLIDSNSAMQLIDVSLYVCLCLPFCHLRPANWQIDTWHGRHLGHQLPNNGGCHRRFSPNSWVKRSNPWSEKKHAMLPLFSPQSCSNTSGTLVTSAMFAWSSIEK